MAQWRYDIPIRDCGFSRNLLTDAATKRLRQDILQSLWRQQFFSQDPLEPVSYRLLPRLLESLDIDPQFGSHTQKVHKSADDFYVALNVSHFSKEEIQVTKTYEDITVKAKHHERHTELGSVSRTYVRRIPIPGNVISETVNSLYLAEDGVLILSAPVLTFGGDIVAAAELPLLESAEDNLSHLSFMA